MAASELVQRRDPWPSVQPAWYDPPWALRGRAATAWFDAPWAVVELAMSPDLLPGPAPSVRTRLRFYDLAFEALGPARGQPLAPREGRFLEGAVGFPARGGGAEGESSLFLWTESDTYLMWAREAFGWPVGLAEIALGGSLWTGAALEGASGNAHLRDRWGSAALLDVRVTARAQEGTPSGSWLTPRRVLHRAGLDGETRELLVVRPVVREPGERYTATGRVRFDFREPHPLHLLGELEAQVEVADGFEIVVGADVEVL
jgi:hypothetical protein